MYPSLEPDEDVLLASSVEFPLAMVDDGMGAALYTHDAGHSGRIPDGVAGIFFTSSAKSRN